MSKEYGIPERTALLALMFAATRIRNPELERRFGVSVSKTVRERLQGDGLITVTPNVQRAIALELTDKGWKWCRGEISAGAPDGAPKAYRLLYAVLQHIDGYLAASGQEQGFFTGQPLGRNQVPIEDRIRSAYAELAGEPHTLVMLSRLRRKLSDIPRAQLDGALRDLDMHSDAHLEPESNQKVLTEEDRQAAIRIGGEDKHALKFLRR